MEPDAESGPQNNASIATGIPPPRASSRGSETDSAHSSLAVVPQLADEAARPSITIRINRDNRDDVDSDNAITRAAADRDYYHEHEFSDLDEITVRQLNKDILAYRCDLDYCKAELEEADLTPQETRTLQLRTLDLGHEIRHCTYRIETIKAQTQKYALHPQYGASAAIPYPTNGTCGSGKQSQIVSGTVGGKRLIDEGYRSVKRVKMASPNLDMMSAGLEDGDGLNTALQRLGFWKCRLCSASKYLLAGVGRSPAAPCKWPLKDISKMITHFTEMHSEHTPAERCVELGSALAQNRGPFEYWLRRTRALNIRDVGIIDDCFDTLLNGEMPDLLRRHSRAAAGMPLS